ncbi:ABC-type glycerol-3-phosphate transport system permease component [Paenibacillus taihuensis]|uniref:ABC-type glycerol-3-phosphate transport system permease component n=1 Tax=Paenibacillus taihuensis TaxID=1156355 RepID=A0A3D9QWA7_9BACL|nr:carbohydrate ABC transporter permease [Paenibacillus taihuensis]REE69553.1 ABC-type glycerol-3-phosphate transport system permease component [Paenibacillus taihuensis]
MPKKLRVKRLSRLTGFDYNNLLILTLFAVVSIFPIIFIINNAFKPLSELFMFPPKFFVNNPTLQNFVDLLSVMGESLVPFSRYVFNSTVVTISSVLLTIMFSSAAAFAFSKMDFFGSKFMFKLIVVSLMFSPAAVSITRYLVISKLGLIDSYAALILPQVALPVGVFLIKQFMDQLPKELLEAARMDGANEWMAFYRIVIPNVKTAVGTVMILSFQSVWADADSSTLYMISEAKKTLPYFGATLTNGLTTSVANQGASAAIALLLFVPNFIIFAIMQRSMIETMVNSGIK